MNAFRNKITGKVYPSIPILYENLPPVLNDWEGVVGVEAPLIIKASPLELTLYQKVTEVLHKINPTLPTGADVLAVAKTIGTQEGVDVDDSTLDVALTSHVQSMRDDALASALSPPEGTTSETWITRANDISAWGLEMVQYARIAQEAGIDWRADGFGFDKESPDLVETIYTLAE